MMGIKTSGAQHCRSRKRQTGLIVTGMLLPLLGLIAIVQPFSEILTIIQLFGYLFIIGSGLLGFYTYKSRRSGQFILKFLLCAIHLLAGCILLINPLKSALTLTLVLGISIFVQGFVQIILALQIRPRINWNWVLLSGVLSIAFGILIWSNSPFGNIFTTKLLVGITFILEGIWIFMLTIVSNARSN